MAGTPPKPQTVRPLLAHPALTLICQAAADFQSIDGTWASSRISALEEELYNLRRSESAEFASAAGKE